MNITDTLFNFLIPLLIIFHLFVAPYTKVEESFNIQATHDILKHGLPTSNITQTLRQQYDHFSFPGVVPRTFVGALILAAISKPVILLTGARALHAQLIVRGSIGLLNAIALIRYKNTLTKAYGKDTGRWFVLLLASQFHVIYYSSRTLPNMFAFCLTTLALDDFLSATLPQLKMRSQKIQKRGVSLLVFAAIVFRSEIAVLLFSQLLYMLVYPRMSLQTMIPTVLKSAFTSIFLTVVIDSYFWQYLVWPELSGFYFNVIQGKSSNWGTFPIHYYYSNLLPKLLLNPLILFILIPIGLKVKAIKCYLLQLITPSLIYITIYSLQPHKEIRFIIYVTVPLTAAASHSAAFIWNQSSRSYIYRLGSIIFILSTFGSSLVSTGMLLISSLNYPGGHAISQLNQIIQHTNSNRFTGQRIPWQINVHMDVLSCMTGVSRFLEISSEDLLGNQIPNTDSVTTRLSYDKTENMTLLQKPDFWQRFDYALMENPKLAAGNWDVIAAVSGYSGIEILRPGRWNTTFLAHIENIVVADENKLAERRKEVVSTYSLNQLITIDGVNSTVMKIRMKGLKFVKSIMTDSRFTSWWWVAPRLEPKIWILHRHVSGET